MRSGYFKNLEQLDLANDDMVNIAWKIQRKQMVSNRKKISGKYKKEKISLVAGAIMLIFVISPVPAFAADGGDEGLS